jgi:hypothetical protein
VPANNRSPFSRGSQSLASDLTPIKPEVLFEAGNMLSDNMGLCDWNPAVSLLAPGSDVVAEPLVPFWATSAAAGVAGNFIGQLHAALPESWPETHRALTVDSAQWPQPIRTRLLRYPTNVLGDVQTERSHYFCPRASANERHRYLPRGMKNHHPTVKPIELCRWLAQLIASPGMTLLDPFAGSGTSGIAAVLERCNFVGIDIDVASVALANARIDGWVKHETRA